MTIVTMHKFNKAHLVEVMEIAKTIGSVEINAYLEGDMIYTLEGVHRVEAAKVLGLPIIFNLKQWDDVMLTDLQDVELDDNGCAKVSDIFEYAYSGYPIDGGVYSTSDFASVEIN
jgi:hypothetical protein